MTSSRRVLSSPVVWSLTFVVDLSVSIDVGLPDHLVHLFVCQLLAQVGHDVPQFGRRDEPVAILKKTPRKRCSTISFLHFSLWCGPCRKRGMLPGSPPRCRCPSFSWPSSLETRGSRWCRCLEPKESSVCYLFLCIFFASA